MRNLEIQPWSFAALVLGVVHGDRVGASTRPVNNPSDAFTAFRMLARASARARHNLSFDQIIYIQSSQRILLVQVRTTLTAKKQIVTQKEAEMARISSSWLKHHFEPFRICSHASG